MSNKEIITINIGGCGVNLGKNVLEQLCVEQGISTSGYIESKTKHESSIPISFNETSNGKQHARTIFYDMDPYSINMVKTMYPYNSLLSEATYVSGKSSCRNNFAQGHYTDGKTRIDLFNDRLRTMVEECDNIQGFMVNHSVCGGTGAGTGCLAMERIAVDYRKKCIYGNCVFPNEKRSQSPIQIYNSLICFHWLLDHNHVSIILDNSQIDNICKQQLNIKTPRYNNYNSLCNKLISTITSQYRFGLGEDMNIFAKDMVPFPRLHFLTAGLAPILPKSKNNYNYKYNIQTLTDKTLLATNFFQQYLDFDCEEDKYMAISFFYKGNNIKKNVFDVNESMRFMMENKKYSYVEWNASCHPSVKYIDSPIVSLPTDDIRGANKRVAMVGNNTAFSRIISERILKLCNLIYSQRAYVHHMCYEGGLEEGEIAEAREDLQSLEKDYLDVLTDTANLLPGTWRGMKKKNRLRLHLR